MAHGGGTFVTQNMILGGAYINVVSAARASATLGDRGVVARPIALTWGKSGEVFTVTAAEFIKDSMKYFGYDYNAPAMLPFREVFKNAQKVHVYNLASDGAKASCKYATAKCPGTRGNDLKIVIQTNIDDESLFDVKVYMGTAIVFKQTVETIADLKENDYVVWQSTELALEAGIVLTGGTDGTVDTTDYQAALNAFESYNFNVLVCPHESAIDLYTNYTIHMRDSVGVKFQTVTPAVSDKVNYIGMVQLPEVQADAIDWAAGALAGCAINKSCTNKLYDGELTITCLHTQSELEQCIKDGVFVFHRVEDEVRVLDDINSFTEFTDDMDEDFASNQTIRVTDQTANDDAREFNDKFHGKVQNDADGRIGFWSNIVTRRKEMARMRAIETYNSDNLKVEKGEKKGAVVVADAYTVIGTMKQLYMTTVIS